MPNPLLDRLDATAARLRSIARRATVGWAIAAAVGVTARTVGWAMTNCPDDVPWQRVVGSDGYLRIARRSAELKQIQESLLKSEGVTVTENGYVERRFFVGADEEEG